MIEHQDEEFYRIGLISLESMSHIFLAVFLHITHDGLSERGTTRSLHRWGTIISINQSINQ